MFNVGNADKILLDLTVEHLLDEAHVFSMTLKLCHFALAAKSHLTFYLLPPSQA